MDLTLLNLAEPTEVRTFEKGRFEVYEVGPATIGRATGERRPQRAVWQTASMLLPSGSST